MIAEWFDAANPWQTGMEHTLFVITVVGALWGAWEARKAWLKEKAERIAAREAAVVARAQQQEAIDRVLRHMDNGGAMLVDKVDKGNKLLADHIHSADGWFKANDTDHKDIHRRIDGVFELLAGNGANTPRKTAERHRVVRNNEDEVG